MKFIGNAFSLGMLSRGVSPTITELSSRPDLSDTMSVVGHADTAAILGVPFRRVSITLRTGDVLFVAQLDGTRLPEGCTVLPEGATFRWFQITV